MCVCSSDCDKLRYEQRRVAKRNSNSVVPLIVLINCVTEREFNYAHMFARIY